MIEMDDLFVPEEKKSFFSPTLLVGVLLGVALIAGAIFWLSQKPPIDQQQAQLLEGALREGSPGFDEVSKNIIISTDRDTVESPTGLGTISMFVKGTIRNRGTKNLSLVEVSVSVVTQMKEVLRERKILVVPNQKEQLAGGESIPITLTFDGFSKNDDRADIRWKVTAIKVAQ